MYRDIHRDIFYYITKFLDYHNLFIFRLTCKKFNEMGEKRFKKILEEKEKENYLSLCKRGDMIVKYLFEKIYKKTLFNLNITLCLCNSIVSKNKNLVKFFLCLNNSNWRKVLHFAIKYNNKYIIKYIKKSNVFIDFVFLVESIKSNNKKMFDKYIKKDEIKGYNPYELLYYSIEIGDKELIRRFKRESSIFPCFTVNLNDILYISSKVGNMKMINYCIDNSINEEECYQYAIKGATINGDIKLIELFDSKIIDKNEAYNCCLYTAISKNSFELVNYFINKIKKNNVNINHKNYNFLDAAIISKNLDMFKFVYNNDISEGVNKYNIELAESLALFDILDYIKEIKVVLINIEEEL